MLYGIIVKFENDSKVVEALGVIFPDGNIYVHNPISDTFHCREDFLTDHPGASIQMVGPVIASELGRKQVIEEYERNKKDLEANFKQALKLFDVLEEMAS